MNAPKLRFPGFEEEWVALNLLQFANRITTKNSGFISTVLTISAQDGLVDQTQYFNKSVASKDLSNYYLMSKNDFAYNKSYSSGYPWGAIKRLKSYDKGVVSPLYICFKINDNTSHVFMEQLFESNKFHRYISEIAQEGARNHGLLNIGISDFFSIKFVLPTLPEQEKIAEFLSSVDNVIQLLTKKKTLLENYKKGIMQKIFSQEIRFKDDDGNNFPEWEEKRLGEVTAIYDGTHNTPDYQSEGIPFYSVENVTGNDFINTKFISKEVFERENKRVKIETEDILMTRIGNIGMPKYIDWDVNASFYVSLALIKHTKDHCNQYLSYFIQSKFFQTELYKRTIHAAFPIKINLSEIGECQVSLPSLPEQQKIADFLSGIDRSIEIVNSQIEKAKEYKKGLLQQMFV